MFAVAAVCDRPSFITFLSSVTDRRYRRIPTGFKSINSGLADSAGLATGTTQETVPTHLSAL
jgi:hypothetical protein